jgi:hypothetical protein
MMRELPEDRGEVDVYRAEGGKSALGVRLAGDAVFLRLKRHTYMMSSTGDMRLWHKNQVVGHRNAHRR